MEYFPRFKWAVPVAFSDAVSRCQFEEGDMLYDSVKAYGDHWERAAASFEYSLQVRYPARGTVTSTESAAGAFAHNWTTPVRVDIYKQLKLVGDQQVETTQGRLYTMLWHGDLGLLSNDTDPPVPMTVRELTRRIDEVSDVARSGAGGRPVFAMARDVSNSVSNQKYLAVLAKVQTHLDGEVKLIGPKQAGFADWERVAPTVDVALFRVQGISAKELHDLVKKAVYVPAKHATKDHFRISAHGAIFD
jgi:hypothetical protein